MHKKRKKKAMRKNNVKPENGATKERGRTATQSEEKEKKNVRW